MNTSTRSSNKKSFFMRLLPGNVWHGRDLVFRLSALIVFALIVAAVLHFFWHLRPVNSLRMAHTTLMVERRSWYEVTTGSRRVLFFSEMAPDSTLSDMSLERDSAFRRDYSAGCWVSRWAALPSCHGRIITSFATIKPITGNVGDLMFKEGNRLKKRIRQINGIRHELIYYLRSHNATDEGFNRVASYNDVLAHEQLKERKLLTLIDDVKFNKDLKITKCSAFTAYYLDYASKLKTVNCYEISDDERLEAVLLRAHDGITPIDAIPFALSPFTSLERGDSIISAGFGGISLQRRMPEITLPVIVPGVFNGEKIDIPIILTGRGAPVFTVKGRFLGINTGSRFIGRKQIGKLFKERGDE
jgi:hypothetical protein